MQGGDLTLIKSILPPSDPLLPLVLDNVVHSNQNNMVKTKNTYEL